MANIVRLAQCGLVRHTLFMLLITLYGKATTSTVAVF